ncbi:alpha/beta hydrolase, partial [Streptomyces sp. BE133]|nr:alpha/beta hydrolase [Streptomyces sp. BE133]
MIRPHVSTVESAGVMEMLRALVGVVMMVLVLSLFGTYLGASYAELCPAPVWRLVLDGAMD